MGCLGYHHGAGKKWEIKQQGGAAAADITFARKLSPPRKVEKVKRGREQQKVSEECGEKEGIKKVQRQKIRRNHATFFQTMFKVKLAKRLREC